MSEEESLIEFPTDFQIKVMGPQADDFESYITDLVRQNIANPDSVSSQVRPSSAGNYLGVTVSLYTVNKAELDEVYRALSGSDRVKMAL